VERSELEGRRQLGLATARKQKREGGWEVRKVKGGSVSRALHHVTTHLPFLIKALTPQPQLPWRFYWKMEGGKRGQEALLHVECQLGFSPVRISCCIAEKGQRLFHLSLLVWGFCRVNIWSFELCDCSNILTENLGGELPWLGGSRELRLRCR